MIPEKSSMPPELLALKQFICWKTEKRGDKNDKVPIAPWATGHWGAASPTDEKNWTDYDNAADWAHRNDGVGIGFCFSESSGIVGIDLDKCISDEGLVDEFASELIGSCDSYSELSPSMRGVHVFLYGSLKRAIIAQGIEIYSQGRFFTLTGKRFKNAPLRINEKKKLIKDLVKRFGRGDGKTAVIPRLDANVIISDLVNLDELRAKKEGEYQGAHPIHGSETGMNFSVNVDKNCWWCFRHRTGGGALSWLAVKEGIISCEECLPRGMTNEVIAGTVARGKELGVYRDATDREIGSLTDAEKADITREMTLDELKSVLGTTIKQDDTNKILHYLAGLLTYTEDGQMNISNRGASSSGKSYIPLEMCGLFFPPEDVLKYAYVSPTAFFHDSGVWDADQRAIRVDLEKKILIFMDQPHDDLLKRLRPLLSHDERELTLKITDKSEKRGMRTKTVIVRGFPTVFFCTGSLQMDEQEATRSIVLSPETTQEKIRAAVFLRALRKGNPEAYTEFLNTNPAWKKLRLRTGMIRSNGVKGVVVPDPKQIAERFVQKYPLLKPRHARDIERIINLTQALALFNVWHRKNGGGVVTASEDDINTAFSLYEEIAQPQELGVSPAIFRFHQEVLLPLMSEKLNATGGWGAGAILLGGGTPPPLNCIYLVECGVSRKEIVKKHYEIYGRPLPGWKLDKEVIPALEASGLVWVAVDPSDRRNRLIFSNLTAVRNLTKIETVLEIPEIVGVDGNKYGPYPPGINTSIPTQNAIALERHGSVKFVGEEKT